MLAGSSVAAANAIEHAGFGAGELDAVLLEGPSAARERQGMLLVSRLRRRFAVLSPWDRGPNSARLSPTGSVSLVLVDLTYGSQRERAGEKLQPLERAIAETVRPPARAHVTGEASAARALNSTALDETKAAQFLAIPLLALVLLLFFRSPVAAAIPAAVGMATVGASTGVIRLVAHDLSLTAQSVSMAAMMGLALGVDYSLLMVSRFREELASGRTSADAASRAAATAGHTVVFAGAVLLVAMAIALVLSPGDVLVSVATGVGIAAILSLVSAAFAVPAALSLLGPSVNRWTIGRAVVRSERLTAGAAAAMARPRLVVGAGLLVLGVLGIFALGLRTTPPGPGELPRDNPVRASADAFGSKLPIGYAAPFELVFATRPGRGVITAPRTLEALARFEGAVAKDRETAGVLGPGVLNRTAGPGSVLTALSKLGDGLPAAAGAVRSLRSGVKRAEAGSAELQVGAATATTATDALRRGADRTQTSASGLRAAGTRAAGGTSQLTQVLDRVAVGTDRVGGAIGSARRGTDRLERGASKVAAATREQLAAGGRQLERALNSGASQLARLKQPAAIASSELGTAYSSLAHMTVGRGDPEYRTAMSSVANAYAAVSGTNPDTGQPVAGGYGGLPDELSKGTLSMRGAGSGAARLAGTAHTLGVETARLGAGAGRVRRGLGGAGLAESRIQAALRGAATNTRSAHAGLLGLADAAAALAAGGAEVSRGADQLAPVTGLAGRLGELRQGLGTAYRRSRPLETQLARSRAQSAQLAPRVGGLTKAGAGEMLLAEIDASARDTRNRAQLVVNASSGGSTARAVLFPRHAVSEQATRALYDRTGKAAARFAEAAGLKAGVTGSGAQVISYQRAASAYIPLLIGALSLFGYLALVFLLRSLVLPAVATLFNLVVAVATLGLERILFVGAHPLLGGPGALDVVAVAGLYTILFALSVDYEVFLLTRMREGYETTREPRGAILYGISRTASVVTSAALIMAVVFLSFGASDFITFRQAGIGLGFAVLLDALLLRIFLLPAAMALLGRRNWGAAVTDPGPSVRK
ncbi:MAG: MMPL family transporter [Gaiellaceae bacterium]